jgi:O-antigen ligase
MMIFVVLTDANPTAAIKRLLASTGFLLIPLSVLFIKYYPELGRGYLEWEWTPVYVGVAGSKNGLGFICFVFGLGALWRLIEALRDKEGSHRLRQTVVHGIMLAMTLWLFRMADSSTSLGCFLLGGLLIITVTVLGRRPATVHVLLGTLTAVGLLAYFYRDVYTYAIESMGRDTTLTGRAELWDDVLALVAHPWFGTGFESFFLGDRLTVLWTKYWWHPNEAHNGYLEIYLTLGWIGVGLLVVQIVAGYRNIVEAFRRTPELGTLRLALLAGALLYNMSEAAFKVMHPVWIAFLLAVAAAPELAGLKEATTPVPSTIPLPPARSGILPPTTPRTFPSRIVARGRPAARHGHAALRENRS